MSRKVTLAILTLTALAVTMAGCRSHRNATHTPPNGNRPGSPAMTDPSTPPAYVPKYYTANFTCTTQGVTANGQLRMQPDSVLWASASKVIELVRARLTPDSVVVYVKVSRQCFRGTYADLYQRFNYRTSFDDVIKMATAEDAETQIADLIRSLHLDATVHLEPWQQVEKLTFPMVIPSNVKPL